jgi:hypothetical protein
MDLEALVRLVDERVHVRGADRTAARLYGVRLLDGEEAEERVHLEELARGDARAITRRLRPPAGLAALALATTGWVAPMEDDGTMSARPSEHPQRRRIHVTVLVGGTDEDVSVLRSGDDEPRLVRGAVGVVHELLVRCWRHRRDAVGSRT